MSGQSVKPPRPKGKQLPRPKSASASTSAASASGSAATASSSVSTESASNRVRLPQKNLAKRQRALFYGSMTRDDTEMFLTRPGDFLLRNVEAGPDLKVLVCSVFAPNDLGNVVNFQVFHRENDFYFASSAKFKSVAELITNHVRNKTPLNADGVYLIKPVYRPRWMLRHQDIWLFKKLGEGAFGEVYLARFRIQHSVRFTVAAKTLHAKLDHESKVEFLKEARVMQRLRHPNIVRAFGVAALAQPMILVMEVCSEGALLSYLKKHGDKIPVPRRNRFAYEAARGLGYLEKQQFIHRDVAARNFMLTRNLSIKVGDFGMAEPLSEMVVAELKKVPIKWLAVETMQKRIYSHKTDVWSYGIALWEIYANGETPYHGLSNMQVRAKVVVQGYRLTPPEKCPEPIAELMKKCWLLNPADRPSFAKLEAELVKYAETSPKPPLKTKPSAAAFKKSRVTKKRPLATASKDKDDKLSNSNRSNKASKAKKSSK